MSVIRNAGTEANEVARIRELCRKVYGIRTWRADPGRGRLKRAGFTAGIPDLIGCLVGGRMLAIEVKRKGARARKNEAAQNETLWHLESRGALVIRGGFDDVKAALDRVVEGAHREAHRNG